MKKLHEIELVLNVGEPGGEPDTHAVLGVFHRSGTAKMNCNQVSWRPFSLRPTTVTDFQSLLRAIRSP